MKIEEVIIQEQDDSSWCIRIRFGACIKDLWIPCVDLETTIRYFACGGCEQYSIKFLNGTVLNVNQNILEVR